RPSRRRRRAGRAAPPSARNWDRPRPAGRSGTGRQAVWRPWTCRHSIGQCGATWATAAHAILLRMSGYCDSAPGHPIHGPYHDTEYGFAQRDEPVLFERLLLEINQAGLSWETILRKRDGFRRAYSGFDVDKV